MMFRRHQRRERRQQKVRRIEDAGRPMTCARCGKAEYFHWCEVWAREVQIWKDAGRQGPPPAPGRLLS